MLPRIYNNCAKNGWFPPLIYVKIAEKAVFPLKYYVRYTPKMFFEKHNFNNFLLLEAMWSYKCSKFRSGVIYTPRHPDWGYKKKTRALAKMLKITSLGINR